MAKSPTDPGKSEKIQSGSGLLEGMTELFPYPMRWVGSAVFLISSVGCVFFLILSGLSQNTGMSSVELANYSYFSFETVEILLRVAAVALVLAALSGERNSLVVIIGLLLVGALIVPTKDMVRIYLAATNSTRQINEFYGDSGGGPELRGRDGQLASTIVDVLSQTGAIPESDDFKRADLYWLVEEEISHERVTTLLERTRARGALDILAQIQDGKVAQTSYRYGDDERHLTTLRFLRNASLITYVYDDLDTMQVTDLGLRVLHRARDDGFSAQTAAIHNSSLYADCFPIGFNEPLRFRLEEGIETRSDNEVWQGHILRLGRHPEFATISVEAENAIRFKILVRTSEGLKGNSSGESDTIDKPEPVIELIDASPDENCRVLGSASNANARSTVPSIDVTLPRGEYLVRLKDDLETRGRVVLALTGHNFDPANSEPIVGFDDPFAFTARADCSMFEGLDDLEIADVSELDQTISRGNPSLYRVSVESGAYDLNLTGLGIEVDPFLMAQFVPNNAECDEANWFGDDDSGIGFRASFLQMAASTGGEFLLSLTSFDEFSEGNARFEMTLVPPLGPVLQEIPQQQAPEISE